LDVIFLDQNYMFRPVVAINRFYHLTHLRLFYVTRVAASLIKDLNIKTIVGAEYLYVGCVGGTRGPPTHPI